MSRYSEEMKLWLFDLAHGNLDNDKIIKGFVKYYVLHNCTMGNVQSDILFHTPYGEEGINTAMSTLNSAINHFTVI